MLYAIVDGLFWMLCSRQIFVSTTFIATLIQFTYMLVVCERKNSCRWSIAKKLYTCQLQIHEKAYNCDVAIRQCSRFSQAI